MTVTYVEVLQIGGETFEYRFAKKQTAMRDLLKAQKIPNLIRGTVERDDGKTRTVVATT